jgi:PBSX family phage portal protein
MHTAAATDQRNFSDAGDTLPQQQDRVVSFTFGDPEPVLDRREIADYFECAKIGRWYEPPVSFDGLARTLRASPHHSSAIHVKCNILAGTFIPHRMLDRQTFAGIALDYLVMGNGFAQRIDAISGRPQKLARSIAKFTRRGVDLDTFYFVHGYRQEHEYKSGAVYQWMAPDVNQEIYGVPEYLSALQAALLNEAATLYRRKYYRNGSHAGYILYINDAAQSDEDIDAIRNALKQAKGPGNFRNLFLYAPNGKEKGVQVIPVSDVAAKDEFTGIKNASRDDVLAAHRVPPQLLGMVPNNTGGFGSPEVAARVFAVNELQPLQEIFRGLNEWIGEEVVRFGEYAMTLPDSPKAKTKAR